MNDSPTISSQFNILLNDIHRYNRRHRAKIPEWLLGELYKIADAVLHLEKNARQLLEPANLRPGKCCGDCTYYRSDYLRCEYYERDVVAWAVCDTFMPLSNPGEA